LDLRIHTIELPRRAVKVRELGRRDWLPNSAHAVSTAARSEGNVDARHEASATPGATSRTGPTSKRDSKPHGYVYRLSSIHR
jgi:hypothetical protein